MCSTFQNHSQPYYNLVTTQAYFGSNKQLKKKKEFYFKRCQRFEGLIQRQYKTCGEQNAQAALKLELIRAKMGKIKESSLCVINGRLIGYEKQVVSKYHELQNYEQQTKKCSADRKKNNTKKLFTQKTIRLTLMIHTIF